MAEGQSMTAREAANNVLGVEHADLLRESVALMVREIMELEVAQLAGAEHGERAPARRSAQRNGYRDRRWDTRVGEMSWRFRGFGRGATSRRFWSPANELSRPSSLSFRRPM